MRKNLAHRFRQSPKDTVKKLISDLEHYDKETGLPTKLVVLFDQLEGLFKQDLTAKADIELLFEISAQLISGEKAVILATMRSDFYPYSIEIESLRALKGEHGHFELGSPTLSTLQEIVQRSAALAGISFEKDELSHQSLDECIVEDAIKYPNPLPLLEFTLKELYRWNPDHLFTFASYNKLGGIAGCLTQCAEQVYAKLSENEQSQFASIMHKLLNPITQSWATTAEFALQLESTFEQ